MEERRLVGGGALDREGSSSVGAEVEGLAEGAVGAGSGLSWRGAAGCAEGVEVARGGG